MCEIRIAVTGHRPQKLYGYNLRTAAWYNLGTAMRNFLLHGVSLGFSLHCYSGMALGVDQVFGLVVLKLRSEGYPVTLTAACPCRRMEVKWKDSSVYNDILASADDIVYVHDGDFIPSCLEKRNQYLLDNADVLLAAYAGGGGGTARCISCALDRKIPVCHLLNGQKNLTPEFPENLFKTTGLTFIRP